MDTPLSITSAAYSSSNPSLVNLVFNDGTGFAVYLNDGSPRIYAHDLLDAWLAEGNTITEPES